MWSIFGILIILFVFVDFVNRLGKGVPLIELMLLIAGLQWIVGPIIEYNFPTEHYRYFMYVPQEEYMLYMVPAYALFVAGVLGASRRYRGMKLPVEDLSHFKNYGLTIFVIGVVFDLLSGSLPGTLGFLAFLVGNFKFAGAIILFFSEDKRLKNIFYFALLLLLFRAIQAAMFHDLILWSVFFYMFWAIKYKPSKTQIYLTILVGILSLSTLQTIKSAYRAQVWEGYQGNKIELFAGLFVDALVFNSAAAENLNNDLNNDLNNVRLNQGWIISAIMDEIPNTTDFQDGRTIVEAIDAALLPRFLNPGKKEAGGQDNFRLFTGLPLRDGTSMGISIVGEAYGNFGVFGGILFMGIWGWFLAWFWGFLLKQTQQNFMLLAFLPIIFLQVIKAETELVVVLNHLIKASIVVFLFFWAVKQFLNWDLKYEPKRSQVN